MITKLNFVTVLMILFISLSQIGCSDNNNKVNQDEPQVYKIESVIVKNANKAQDFTFEIDGKKHSFLEYTKNKIVFLNFWATWCPPCRKEIPYIVDIQNEYRDKELVVIGVAMENPGGDPAEKVQTYAKSKNINYINFVGERQILGQLSNAYGDIQGIPTTFIIDRDANIHRKIVGGRSKEEFVNEFKSIL